MTDTWFSKYIKIGANIMRKDDTKRKEVPEREIDIIPILKELLKKLWLIILVGLILGGAVFVGTKVLIKPTYRSGFTAYVNNKQGKESTDYLTSSDVTASKQELDASYNTLQKLVSTEVKDETEIISVFVVDTDPQFAYDYAQAISKTAPQYMAQIVEGSSMKIIDYPEFSDKRYKPSYSNFALIGFLIGALIVVVFVIIRYFMDDTVKSESDIESSFSIPILGVIPDVSKASNNHSDYYYYSQNSEDKKSESEQKDEEK